MSSRSALARLAFAIVSVVLLFAVSAGAAPVVPEPLRPWTDWVLSDDSDRSCAVLPGQKDERRCVWEAPPVE